MVGDSAKDDVVCGNRAGGVTVLLDTEGRYSTPEGAASLEVSWAVSTVYDEGGGGGVSQMMWCVATGQGVSQSYWTLKGATRLLRGLHH
jgi:hypothetical protein